MKRISIKRGISFLSAFIIGMAAIASLLGNEITVRAEATNVSNPRIAKDGTVTWDKVTFGSYYQDMNEIKEEPIKWRILDIDKDGNALLLSDYVLDYKPYNEKGVEETISIGGDTDTYTNCSCTWATSTLRSWLNGIGDYASDNTAFIKVAFTDTERDAIIETNVDTNYITDDENGSNNTLDKIYLLSRSEATNNSYGFKSEVDGEQGRDECREAKVTDYATDFGSHRDSKSLDYDTLGNGDWLLRSSGYVSYSDYVDDYGDFRDDDISMGSYPEGVRPVLHVNLSNVKDAGKVSSDGEAVAGTNRISSQYSNPITKTDGVTTWDCVYFGKYKQNATFNKKPIEWRVLSVNGDDALLLAERALDRRPYGYAYRGKYVEDNDCSWETSILRKWLNDTTDSTSFINIAFTEEEQKSIRETIVINDDGRYDEGEGGNNTHDKIYLLSVVEATNRSYGFDNGERESETRQTKTTKYAYVNGACETSFDALEHPFDISNNYPWLLRSPMGMDGSPALVFPNGSIVDSGYYIEMPESYLIRPVLHVNLNSAYVMNAGTVSSGSEMIDESEIDYDSGNNTGVTPATTEQTTNKEQKVATPSNVTISSAKNSKKKSIIIKWKKVKNAKGYEVQYALNKKFTKSKKSKTLSKFTFTAKKLKKGKTYYIRVRAYNLNSSKKKIYGKWSKVKKVKIKK